MAEDSATSLPVSIQVWFIQVYEDPRVARRRAVLREWAAAAAQAARVAAILAQEMLVRAMRGLCTQAAADTA